ncbi:hypothetical protein ACNQGP_02400 [Flavobacterium sp. GT2N3]|uniref:hypothetical protein n=1 Tax=unclassified Flavobacterium TaxID=196869 RepID=UPI003AB0D403
MQSCTTEEVVLEREANKKNYVTSEKVSIENVLSVLKNPVILNQTETFKTNTPESITQKGGKKPNVYFTKIVKGNEYTTYLLLLNSYSTKNPYFMYYSITQNATTEKVGYLKYIPDTPTSLLDISTFSGKIQMLDLKKKIRTESSFLNGQPKKHTTSATARTTDDCTSSSSIITHYCGSDEAHSPGQKCTDPTKAYYEVLIVTTCPYVSPYDNSAPVPNEFINNSTGGGGGANVEDFIISFEGILSLRQKIWWDNYSNDPLKQEIITYLGQNPTNEGILFSLEMIDQMRANPDLFRSIKPFLIEKNIDDTNLDACSEGVFQQIKNTTICDFAYIFAKLGADDSIYNTTMKTEHNSVMVNGQLQEVGDPANTIRTTPGTKYNYTVYVNPEYPGKTKLFIAAVLLHEMAHAYFFSLVDDYNMEATNSFNELPILFNAAVVNKFPIGSTLHHEEIANSYVNAIASALQEFQPGLTQQVYDDLAWGGLKGTPIFDTLFPVGNPNRQRIINRYDSEGTGTDQGSTNQQNPMGQPCN